MVWAVSLILIQGTRSSLILLPVRARPLHALRPLPHGCGPAPAVGPAAAARGTCTLASIAHVLCLTPHASCPGVLCVPHSLRPNSARRHVRSSSRTPSPS